MKRRNLLGLALPVGAAVLAQAGCSADRAAHGPLALVYRGPASSPGCPEAAAALLRGSPERFRVRYCGPQGDVPVTAAALAAAQLYVQPGGGQDLDGAWRAIRPFADPLRAWLRGGGRYLGICMGAYLAGRDPGLGLLPGDTNGYVGSRGSTTTTARDTVISVRWRGRQRHMYFQDGPYFILDRGAAASVLATYDNGTPAAVVTRYGRGRVGVVGPHPEADASWYADYDLTNPDGVRFDLGYDLVRTLMG